MSGDDGDRPSKRQRLSDKPAEQSHSPAPSLPDLLAWLDREGVWLSDKLECRDMKDGEGWAIFALENADPHEIVSKIPKTAVLSTRTSAFPALLPPNTLKQIPQIALLTLCLMYELRGGTSSRWHGYLQSLPRVCVPIASLWDIEELFGEDGEAACEWLKHTEVTRNLKRIGHEGHGRSDLHLYLEATKGYFPPTTLHPDLPSQLELYNAYSLVCSRVFQVDKFHGIAMSPHADLFNHREANHVAFEADDFVCTVCGSLQECEHDVLVEVENGSEQLRVPDRMSHVSPATIAVIAKDHHVDTVDMTVHRSFKAGDEVFNSYGDNHGAAKMLCEYGFIDTSDAADVYGSWGLRFDVSDVLRADEDETDGGAPRLAGRHDAEALRKHWQKVARRVLDEAESLDFDAPARLTRTRPPAWANSAGWTEYARSMPLDSTAWPVHAAHHDASAKETLSLHSDGQISRTLLALLVVDVLAANKLQSGVDATEQLSEQVVYFADTVWRLHVEAEDDRPIQALTSEAKIVAHRVARRVLEVLDARWARVLDMAKEACEGPFLTSVGTALELALEATPLDRPLTRTAIQLARMEYSSTLPTRYRWTTIRDLTDEDFGPVLSTSTVC